MKMKIILSAFIVFALASCKKDNPTTSTAEQPLLQDGPLSLQLGKLIYLGDHGHSRSTPFWGRNSDELFITASTEILQIDIAAKRIDAVEKSVGLVTGKTNENSAIIFLGTINSQRGYYLFNFSSNSTEKIIEVPNNQGTRINIAGNDIFYYLSPVSPPNPPCNGFCWPLPGPSVPAIFYHLDKQTRERTDLENKQFGLFSTDGSRAILFSQLESRMYVFDIASRTIIDSSDLNNTSSFFSGLFYNSDVLNSFAVDVTGNITIKNFNTGQVLRQYQTNYVGLDDFRVSSDGTKLYYSGGVLNGNALNILLYDIDTNAEKTIAELPFGEGGGLPFDVLYCQMIIKKWSFNPETISILKWLSN
ncbi:hypothetical protein QTN47_25305 [Danxiaibacter flavus]|uniref:DUF5050 domain-containing protein n=1 Tax=Danxiaibacter flavus TaxID=3049108 RepID=A0ABV3ZLT4_9BACT|nr:hypothetical protein QNM32_25310 [Chitinophagaceae bacterium DXS]